MSISTTRKLALALLVNVTGWEGKSYRGKVWF